MKLKTYLAKKKGSNVWLAEKLGVTPSTVSQWRNGTRPIPFEHCVPIELATVGEVSRKDLCPKDWYIHWPELSQQDKPKEAA